MDISVREIMINDIPFIADYWINATSAQLRAMGAVKELIPPKDYWFQALETQIDSGYTDKQSYCIIWLLEGLPIGHCNVNKIIFGQEAYMHLHLWRPTDRKSGLGASLVKLSIPYFFNNLQLKTLYCEPYALNEAPNRTLAKLGFELIQEYVTVPGSICFEQPVKRWKLERDVFYSEKEKKN